MTRIGFSGTNWTRKTTTIAELARSFADGGEFEIVSLSKLVANCPYPMGPDQTLDGSRWMIEKVAELMDKADRNVKLQIFDRTPLDILAFTMYVIEFRENVEPSFVNDLITEIQMVGEDFDATFFCEPLADWPEPESPPTQSIEFAKLIDRHMSAAIAKWPSRVTRLPWDIGERIEKIQEILIDSNNGRKTISTSRSS